MIPTEQRIQFIGVLIDMHLGIMYMPKDRWMNIQHFVTFALRQSLSLCLNCNNVSVSWCQHMLSTSPARNSVFFSSPTTRTTILLSPVVAYSIERLQRRLVVAIYISSSTPQWWVWELIYRNCKWQGSGANISMFAGLQSLIRSFKSADQSSRF